MIISRVANGMTLILLSLCILFGLVIYRQWTELNIYDLSALGEIDKTENKQPGNGVLNSLGQKNVNMSQFSETTNRPLFVEGRMPYEEDEDQQEVEKQLSPIRLSLEGVVISSESRLAVVRDLTNNNLLRLGEGMVHNGWKVINVDKHSLEMSRGEDTQTIEIEIVKDVSEKAKSAGFKLPINKRIQNNLPRR